MGFIYFFIIKCFVVYVLEKYVFVRVRACACIGETMSMNGTRSVYFRELTESLMTRNEQPFNFQNAHVFLSLPLTLFLSLSLSLSLPLSLSLTFLQKCKKT